MNRKFETVFRTYSYRLYPTKMQQLELKALFDLQDHAFNDWADLANRGVAQGKSYETIQKEIESHEILTERREDRYALSVTRSHVLTLARRLYDHQIERIRFRLPDRQQRSFTYKTVGISEHYLVIPSIGTIASTTSKIYAHAIQSSDEAASQYLDNILRPKTATHGKKNMS